MVANGESLYSSLNDSDTSYGYYSGTSMASPNACGSAALLVQQFSQLFSGGAMRASTLKGLLIHTADDRGNAGPDYKFGWGLVNVGAAADLLIDHQAHPAKLRITENQLTTSITTRTHAFVWDGASPIRATLCWTDVAGSSTTTSVQLIGESLRCQFNLGGTAADLSVTAGAASGTLVISPGNDWDSWIATHFTTEEISKGLAAETVDPDGDGLRAEFAVALIPFHCERSGLSSSVILLRFYDWQGDEP